MIIAIVNLSKRITDTQGQTIVNGLNTLLPKFCSDWGLSPWKAVYIQNGRLSYIDLKVFLVDSDTSETLVDDPSIPHGKCYVDNILGNGGVVLYSANKKLSTFAQVVSREVFELLLDPLSNGWWTGEDKNTLYAREACDPVEGNIVEVNVQVSPATPTYSEEKKKTILKPAVYEMVGFSDWILPAWVDSNNKKGPFNHLNTLKEPFSVGSEGYAIKMTNVDSRQTTSITFGEAVTDSNKQIYLSNYRVSKRMT